MELKTKLQEELKDAMRANDARRKTTIRMALAAIKLAEIDKGTPLDENGVMAILQKEVKSRLESIADAERAGRADLVTEAQGEMAILEEFLPKAFSDDELEALAKQAISAAGATSLKEMGQVMKLLMPQLQGKASGERASQVVRGLLEG